MTQGDNWWTPEWFLDLVRLIAAIALDPFSAVSNPTGAAAFITKDDQPDGLTANWFARCGNGTGLVFVNPPYSRTFTGPVADKVILEARRGCEIVLLCRGDLSTAWARKLTVAAQLVCFPPRIKFRSAVGSPNFSNAIFYFGKRPDAFRAAFEATGPICQPITSNSPGISAAPRNHEKRSTGAS